MPKYPKIHYDKFVQLANEQGSGLEKGWHQDGALKSLGALLRKDSSQDDIVSAIKALADVKDNTHTNKQRKYRKAIRHLEDTFPIPQDKRVWRGMEAVKYLREPTRPSVIFKDNNIDYSSLKLIKTTLQRIGVSVEDYMEDNSNTTRMLLIHLGQPQEDMNHKWDGATALQHMNSVISKAAQKGVPICILRDPHSGVRGQNVPKPVDAVCDGLRHAIGQVPGNNVWVADGGGQHSAFHDPKFQGWVDLEEVKTVIVMGFDADICVRGNVFGVSEKAEGVNPPSLVPALLNFADVLTSRPLLSGGGAGTIQQIDSWGDLVYAKRD